jgi:hypothetical protein
MKKFTLKDGEIEVLATGKLENSIAVWFESTEGTCGVLMLEPARAEAMARHILRQLEKTTVSYEL